MILVAENSKRGEQMRAIRNRLGMPMTKFAQRLGVKETTYRNWEYGLSTKVPDDVFLAAQRLGAQSDVSEPKNMALQLLIPIMTIGMVSAGAKANWTDPFASEEWEYVPPEMGDARGRFAAVVESDSCFDLLWPGDVVVFQHQATPKIGSIVLWRSNDNLLTIKQLKHDGKEYVLVPVNPSYETVRAEGVQVGYLVGIVRQSGSKRVTVYDPSGIRP